jgi:hypothetical protein
VSSSPPSLVTRLRREKTRPKTSFSSSESVKGFLVVTAASPLLVMLDADSGRCDLPEEVGRDVQRRE